MSGAEARFKAAVLALVWQGIYPGPVQIRRELGRPDGSQTINGRQTRWRAELLRALGWTARPWPHRRRFTWLGPAVIALLCLMLPACAARQAIPIAAGADLLTTEIAIHRGGYEANPLPGFQTTGGRVALKAAATAFLVWLCERLEADGHHTTAEILKWTAVGAWGGAAVWNANVARAQ